MLTAGLVGLAVCFGLWLDAGGVGRDRSDAADGYGTAAIVLAWALVVLLAVPLVRRLTRLRRRDRR